LKRGRVAASWQTMVTGTQLKNAARKRCINQNSLKHFAASIVYHFSANIFLPVHPRKCNNTSTRKVSDE
jgi:hypothetical protein